MAEMGLTGLKDQVRDIFLVGCYTYQRVSDNNIQSEGFTTTAKGTPIIRLVQQKTRNEVKIPIMNPNLEAICKKYEYNLPSVVDQILNRYIKEILKDLSESVPTLAVKVPTKLTMKQKEKEKAGELTVERNDKGEVMMPRYDCVTTPHRPTQWHYQYVPQLQIHHTPDDARKRPQDSKDLHGLHQAFLRGDSQRNRRHVQERE